MVPAATGHPPDKDQPRISTPGTGRRADKRAGGVLTDGHRQKECHLAVAIQAIAIPAEAEATALQEA
jgi:hypothetical protein